jgi:glyoxylase-like metal-dependent hydrolase (beta-lactamase superfamily II)
MRRTLVLGVIVLTGVVTAALLSAQERGREGAQGREGGRGGGRGPVPVQKIEKVKGNLYMIQGQGGNTAVYVAQNGVVVVDTKNPNNGQPILDQIKSVTDKPITTIINTHTHADHTGSNPFFQPSVDIIVQDNTAANMKKMEMYQQEANKNGLPDRTFKDKMSLLKGKDQIDLYYFGPAHTDGDAFVVFKNLRVMHAGDAFANKGQPLIDRNNGGSGIAYPDTLAKAAKGVKNVDTVINGHTTMVTTWQDFVDFGEFNRLYLAHARESMKAGKSAEDALKTLTLPEKFKGYNIAPGGRGGPGGNFAIIYEELKGAK